MRARLRASGLDIAPLHRSGQEEIELGATRRGVDLDLTNVRVPRQLGQQSKPHRERGVAEGRWPFVVAADSGRLVRVHHMRTKGPTFERVAAGYELGDRG